MGEDLNNFFPSIFPPRYKRKHNTNNSTPFPRQPLQLLSQESNIILDNGDADKFKFIKAVHSLNIYHKRLIKSVENQNENMSQKPKPKASINTPKSKVKKQKNTLLNYFNSSFSDKNDSPNPVIKRKIEEISTRSKKISEPINMTVPIYDLCDGSDSSTSDHCDSSLFSCRISKEKNNLSKRSTDVTNDSNICPDISMSMSCSKTVQSLSERCLKSSPMVSKQFLAFSTQKTKQKKICPPYKIVKDSPFAVDAFSYGEIPGVSIYFLTHFHSDHYMGLNKSFKKPIYCTKITADLCQQKLYTKSNIINILEVGKTVLICGIEVTTVDANHCPGSIMLVFSLPCGRNILHCGDFRASPLMESYPVFWNKQIDTVYLDTTYCNPRYNFPTQHESINQAIAIILEKKQSMIRDGTPFTKLLIVCGTYTIGKENFFVGIANEFKIDVWASAEKNKILKVALGKDFQAKQAQNCQLHVLPMNKLHYHFLDDYLKSLGNSFSYVIAFKPSGWELSKGSLIQRGNVTIHGIPYSEHSSFSELQRFIKFLQPKAIIPTVIGNGGCDGMQKYFSCWVGDGENSQKRVSDYFKVLKP